MMMTSSNRQIELLCQIALISEWDNTPGNQAHEVWDNFKEVMEWIAGWPFIKYEEFPNDCGPDVCLYCNKYFGNVFGGRIREGCFYCQGRCNFGRSTIVRFYDLLKDTFGRAIVELEMARALYLKEIRK